MEHLIFATYVLLFTSGSACVIALAFMRIRLKSRLVVHFLWVEICLLGGLGLVLVYYYLRNIVAAGDHSIAMRSIGIATTILQAVLYAIGFGLASSLRSGGRFHRALKETTKILCAAVIATSIVAATVSLFPRFIPGWLTNNAPFLNASGYVMVGAALFALGTCLLLAPLQGEHPAIRLLVRGWAISLLLFAPLSALEWALVAFGPHTYAPLSLDFIFYVSCNAVSVVAFTRSLRTDGDLGERTMRVKVSEEVAARFGLTMRERDMIPLIAKGLANKEIASELGISSATVRTHIYNMFQKVGANGRIDFLNKLGS